ncbi:MAG: prepilin-type N-terminal cleavage/methylation domain-containing protein [Fimbriimonas sp.]
MRRAFTLIELLVVIAIIAILAALLFPVFASAKEAAKMTQSLSNTKQIATGQLLYSNDYDDAVIPSNAARDQEGDPQLAPIAEQIAASWVNTLQPYVKNTGILFNPSFNPGNLMRAMKYKNRAGIAVCDGETDADILPLLPADGKYLSHYGVARHVKWWTDCANSTPDAPYANYAGSGWTNDNGTFSWQTITTTQVVEPARTANIGDAYTAVSRDGSRVVTKFGCEAQYRHRNDGGTFSFLDGHSKYLKGNPEEIVETRDGCSFEKYFTFDR